ncbi:MAG: DUF167 domain-containing protein [Alphaproteobacteria bacterium]|nr:DUF167 domain-containing protein [Alphaproteobacteria bacterium]
MINNIFIDTNSGVLINIYLTPGAHKSCINGLIQTIDNKVYIKISVNGKPIENQANKELICIISKYFKLPKSNIEIIRGSKSRYKQIRLKNYNICDIPKNVINELIK